jgi:anti-sigma regulatory factor (Ser/Thr protein kinase)
LPDRAFERTVPSPTSVTALRHGFRAWLQGEGLPVEDVDVWELALSELAANATGYSPAGSPVEVRARRDDDRITLSITNTMDGHRVPRVPQTVPPDAVRGRGLFIVDRLVDGLAFDVDDSRVTATCWRAYPTG